MLNMLPRSPRSSLVFLVILSVLGNSAALFAETSPEKPIKVGAMLWLTSDVAMQASAFQEGAQIALDEYLLSRNPRDPLVQLVVENVAGGKSSKTAGKKLLEADRVSAALFQSYQDLMVAGPDFEKSKVPVITLWDSNPEMDDAGEYLFAIGPWTPSSGEVGAKFSIENLHAKTAIVVVSAETWPESVGEYFRKEFERRGGQVLDLLTIKGRTRKIDPEECFLNGIDALAWFEDALVTVFVQAA